MIAVYTVKCNQIKDGLMAVCTVKCNQSKDGLIAECTVIYRSVNQAVYPELGFTDDRRGIHPSYLQIDGWR